MKRNQRGSLTVTALFTILIFSLYGILLLLRSVSSYNRQSQSIETIQNVYAQDVDNSAHVAKQLNSTAVYAGEYFVVSFNPSNGEAVFTEKVAPGNKVPEPDNPDKSGDVFDGWYYYEMSGTLEEPTYTATLFDFDQPITSDMNIFAKYVGD